MEAASLSTEIEAATIADVQKSEIRRLALGIADWLAGIGSSVETGAVRRGDLNALHRELAGVEHRLERLTTQIVLDR